MNRKARKTTTPKLLGVKRMRNTRSPSAITLDDDVSSSGSENEDISQEEPGEVTMESAEHKRLRLAKEYISQFTQDDSHSSSKTVTEELRKQRLRYSGELFHDLSSQFAALDPEACTKRVMNAHAGPVTAVAVTGSETSVFSGSKDNSIIMWDTESGKRDIIRNRWARSTHLSQQSYEGEVLALALSSDDRFLAAGGRDNTIRIYDRRMQYAEVHAFKGHRDVVSCLTFQRNSYELFSGSFDRSIKHWTVQEMGYIETLFGHQEMISSMDCWSKCRPVSASLDRTARLWKVEEETHSVFRSHSASVEAVQMLTDSTFVSGGQDGSLKLWKDSYKSPVETVSAAHGFQKHLSYPPTIASTSSGNANWIASLAAIKMSNIVASGSCDGAVRLWNANTETSSLSPLKAIPVAGVVNALHISPTMMVCGCGREPRLGRWNSVRGNHNSVVLIRFSVNADL